jgi:hypothetical protein
MPSPWVPDVCASLTALVDEGLKSPQIAARLNEIHGTHFSKSAVISKCAKLGLLLKHGCGGPNNKSGAQRCFWGPARRT